MEAVAKLPFPGARSPHSQGQDVPHDSLLRHPMQGRGKFADKERDAPVSVMPRRCCPPRGGGDRGAPGPARLRGHGRRARERPSPAGRCLLPPRRPSPRAKLDGSRRAPLAAFPSLLPAVLPYALPRRTLPCRLRGRGLPSPARRAARPGLTLRNAAGGMCMQMRWMLISC